MAHAFVYNLDNLVKLKKYEGNPLESRAFVYLDVISWLQSKISGVNVQDIIREKFAVEKK